MGGGPLLTGGRVYENGAEAYLYDSAVYIPLLTAEKIMNS